MLTRRQILQTGALSLVAATSTIAGAIAAPLHYALKPLKLDEGVWLVPGAQENITLQNGGAIANSAILKTKAGAVIIDTGPSYAYGRALSALATELTGQPVVRVYLTHFHPDHVFGNQAFEANVLASTSGVIDGLKQLGERFADNMYRSAGDWMRGTELRLPGTILTDEPEDFGDRVLRPLRMQGHTPSDLVLFDEASGIIFAGDLVFLDRAPTTPHANLESWKISLANLGGIPHNVLVPGHGPAEPGERGTKQTREWLMAIERQIKDAFKAGLDITEAIALPLPAWTERIALARYEYERSVMHLYPKYEAELLPHVAP